MKQLHDLMIEANLNELESILENLVDNFGEKIISEAKERKTEAEYTLWGKYEGKWEKIDHSNNLKEIRNNLKEYNENEGGQYKITHKRVKKKLDEAVTDIPDGTLADMFEEAVKRLDAARRGLGLTNKLPPGPQRQQHRARILGNLNRLRALVDRMVKTADTEKFTADQQIRMNDNRNTAI